MIGLMRGENIDFVCRCHDLGNTDLWDKIHLLFKAAIDNEDMSPEVRLNESYLWNSICCLNRLLINALVLLIVVYFGVYINWIFNSIKIC